jgi:hypothetical protein
MVHVWEKVDLRFTAQSAYENAYTEVVVWVDLEGPGFAKRVYGFWDGGSAFVVRVLATRPGSWTWRAGSSTNDAGLEGKSGSFTAEPWSSSDLEANPNRRGMVVASPDGRGLEYADGTPFLLIADTWWSVPSFRFKLADVDAPKALGPDATLNDYAHFRRQQGYNCIAMIAAQPAWANDGHPPLITLDDGSFVRSAWKQPGTESAKDMHNEGGRPFEFPGKVPGYEDVLPDLDRVNPAYFKVLDAKIDYLNAIGIVPFIEVARRDTGQMWKKFHDFPESYSRFIQYIFARYQANITILSPIHYDYYRQTIPAQEYNVPINLMIERYGKPPFGTLLTANPNPSTYVNFGPNSWVDLHQIGNEREHYTYWFLTEMFEAERKPSLNGEPYYSGLQALVPEHLRVAPDSEADGCYVRSGLYGSFLSGGMAGYVYGAEGIWQADIEPDSAIFMWDAMRWTTGEQIPHLKAFAEVRGQRYRLLEPKSEAVMPNKSGPDLSYGGWSYCARTADKDLFLLYFENEAPLEAKLRGVELGARYRASFFDPRQGEWGPAGQAQPVPDSGILDLPQRPDSRDWGMMLERVS